MAARIRLGCAGWGYDDWVGPFYPSGTKPGDYLARYARVFDFVEVNTSYYGAPTRERVREWDAKTPPGFLFSLKLPDRITSEAKLDGVEQEVSRFLETLAPLRVAGKLAPLVCQLPPSFRYDKHAANLERFLAAWPQEEPLAVELRDKSWWRDETYALLRAHGVPLVWAVTEYGRAPPVVTAKDVYVRLIGDRALDAGPQAWGHVQRDQSSEIAYWVREVQRASDEVFTIFVIANNHFMGFAPEAARRVAAALGAPPPNLAAARGQRGLDLF